ncbi:hypothetical protein N0V90_000693 [Kalmusia sp. IMI 367209]|nr:hypothetical protein N0V90_000693 [Kalmusia sp. IMI 367209]
MLSYPDRHKFEEIRSRWEAVQILNDEQRARMVGRKEKPGAHQPLSGDEDTGASKFRRKLSHGLSFISYPLSQRRPTPVRPSLLSNDLTNIIDIPHPHESTRLLSPLRDPSLRSSQALRKVTSKNFGTPAKSSDIDATSKSLPRSHTMSFIPRPSRSESGSPVIESESAPTPRPHAFALEQEVYARPSKIPSPGPPASAPRQSSPRQYKPNLSTQQAKQVAAVDASTGINTQSPPKASVRSYTTPNLVKPAPPANFMSPRKSNQNRISSIPTPQRPNMKENSTPTGHRHVKRLSNIQEHSPRRESINGPIVASKRRSLRPAGTLAQSKVARTTPPTSSKRNGSQVVVQTPLAAQRAVHKRSPLYPIGPLTASNGTAVFQSRLLGPVSPPTPPASDHASARPSLPRANTDKDFRKRTLTTPYKRIGAGMLLRSQAGANNEVRLPRSSTYYGLVEGFDTTPPVPPIPEKYSTASMPVLVPKHEPPRVLSNHLERENVQMQDRKETHLYSINSSPIPDLGLYVLGNRKKTKSNGDVRRTRELVSRDQSKLRVNIPGIGRTFSASLLFSTRPSTDGTVTSQSWSAKNSQFMDCANVGVSKQVKEYMPALYWAGRFQSRFDQWRTEAMQVELNPGYRFEGPLSQCNLHQEKAAACHIFLQLRDLCLSNQAADSLWEFEHKYRQEHNLLGTSFDLPPLNPKPDDGISKQGSFGRAVRKMTPRKSSFVNLLKGKGWNKEELISTGGSADHEFTLTTKTFESSEEDH